MKKRITELLLIDLLFLLLLIISGMVKGIWGEALYLLAYILPIGAGLFLLRRHDIFSEPSALVLGKDKLLFSASLFAPTMLLVIAVSALTTLVLAFFGKTNEVDVSGHLVYELFRHALIPAVLEELLFRYIPIKILSPKSKRGAIWVSALLFALIHLNLFQIPYALLAGAVLAFLTVVSGSILPAIILHFLNNSVSVLWMRNPDVAPAVIIPVLVFLSVISAVYIVRKRREYVEETVRAFSGDRVGFSAELLVMTALCLIMSFLSL